MPNINKLTVIVAYDIADADRRNSIAEYILDTLSGERKTESVYEFVYNPPLIPKFPTILQTLREMMDARQDEIYLWDIDNGNLRRIEL